MTLSAFLAYIYVYGSAAVSFVVANWATILGMLELGTAIPDVIQWILGQI